MILKQQYAVTVAILGARLSRIAAIHHKAERFSEALAAWSGVLAIEPEHTVARKRREECEMV